MTKHELEGVVEALRAEVAALSLDAEARAHLERLQGLAAPYQRRLAALEGLETGVVKATDAEELKMALMRLDACQLDGKEVTAYNGVLRQMGEVLGVLKGRVPAGKRGPLEVEKPAAKPVSDKVGTGKLKNVVKMVGRTSA